MPESNRINMTNMSATGLADSWTTEVKTERQRERERLRDEERQSNKTSRQANYIYVNHITGTIYLRMYVHQNLGSDQFKRFL